MKYFNLPSPIHPSFMHFFLALAFILFLTPLSSRSQNLVPNPSFEDTIACPSTLDQVDRCLNWFSAANSPDYFNSCSPYIPNFYQASVPLNGVGFQPAYSGNGYCGFLTIANNANYREYIGVHLNSILSIGTTYYFTALISPGYGGIQKIFSFSNNVGILLSKNLYHANFNPLPLNNFSTANYDTLIDDTLNWKHIQFTFVADSAYEYLYIGNFYDDQSTDSITANVPLSIGAYIYIDHVCLSTSLSNCSITGLQLINENDPVSFYPNPFNQTLSIRSDKEREYAIYDILGKLIRKVYVVAGDHSIDLSDLNAGLYLMVDQKFKTQKYKLQKL